MAQLNVTELDFASIKSNLKNFLKDQSEFSDYDFEGSGLSHIIELLAYNTHYNGMLAHMLANENFIDTAIKRESVVSIAKALGYTPQSRTGAVAKVNISIEPDSSYTSTTLEINRNQELTSTLDGTTYKFYPKETTVVSATTAGGTGPYYIYGTDSGTTNYGKGYYYPVYLTEAAAVAADTSSSPGAHNHTFKEYAGKTFYMPNGNMNHAKETLGTTSQTDYGVSVSSGLAYGRYTGQTASSAKVTQFNFDSLEVKEGTRISNQFVVEPTTLQGPFTIPNPNVDISTIRVRVKESTTSTTIDTFSKQDKFLNVTSTTKAYFVEEGPDGLYQLKFGDGVIGKALTSDNIIICDYIVTNGSLGNFAKSFSLSGVLSGSNEVQSIQNASQSSGGIAKENIDSIRFNAPRFNATRDRAVTSADYEALILSSNPNVASVSVWGGEKNDPPMYGKVFISLNPQMGSVITDSDKDNIRTQVIEPKTPVAIMPEFVDPEYTYIGFDIGIVYDPKVTTLSKGEIESGASSAITDYFNTSLNKLNKSFYFTKLHNRILKSSDSIKSLNIVLKLQKRLTVEYNTTKNYTVKFNHKLQPRELGSTFFNLTIGAVNHKVTLADVPNAGVVAPNYSGTGVVNAVGSDGSIVAAIGTIDYDSGTVSIPSIKIASLLGTDTAIKINTRPQSSVTDITTQALVRTSDTSTAAVVAKPSRNTVLSLDDSVINSTTNSKKGLTLNATPEVDEV
tara:strand:- start:14519 stop:16720 length:2202 start_codon:yes stop_codon:yes gene_type:complete